MRNEIANFKDCKSIAIMGGTFDPIHNGHLVTAEAVRHRFKVDRVVFIPTGRPAHKAKNIGHSPNFELDNAVFAPAVDMFVNFILENQNGIDLK